MSAPARYLLATTNRDKIREIRALLADLPITLVGLDELPAIVPPEETGATFAENARLKAQYYAARTHLSAIAEDSGLEVDAIGGIPGVQSARFCGEEATYPERFAEIYRRLDAAGANGSTARFVCHVAVANHDAIVFEARGTVEGRIAPEPRGANGFGYDPIFFHPASGMTLGEAPPERKAAVSHRAEAFRKLAEFLADSGLPTPDFRP